MTSWTLACVYSYCDDSKPDTGVGWLTQGNSSNYYDALFAVDRQEQMAQVVWPISAYVSSGVAILPCLQVLLGTKSLDKRLRNTAY